MNLKNKTYDELWDLKDEIDKEMFIREREKDPVGYTCDECSYKVLLNKNISGDDAFWNVYDHLQKVHGYPDEDAGLSVKRINR